MPNAQRHKIKGYRELSDDEIALMNLIQEVGEAMGELVDKVSSIEGVDQRWAAIGRKDLQTGLMALNRSITQPDMF